MVYYFKFEIPTNADGTRVSYSPNYHGTMPKCPEGVTVLLYNDKEGYGIAQTEDTFIPKEVTKITKTEATKILAEVKDEPQVYKGSKIADLWDYTKIIDKTLPGMEAIKVAAEAALKEIQDGK